MSNLLGLKTGRPSGRTAEHVKGLMDDAEEEKRLNVIMPAGEYHALKVYAASQKKTISEIIRSAIKQTMTA
jgi:hypothetical protein